MRSACAPSVCNSETPRCFASRSISAWRRSGTFFWEAAQLPLYTLWRTGAPREIVSALFHCTGGDILITTFTLAGAVALAWHFHWRAIGWRMVFTAILLGAAYTVFRSGSTSIFGAAGPIPTRCRFYPYSALVSRRCSSGWSSQAWPSPLLWAGSDDGKGREGPPSPSSSLVLSGILKGSNPPESVLIS